MAKFQSELEQVIGLGKAFKGHPRIQQLLDQAYSEICVLVAQSHLGKTIPRPPGDADARAGDAGTGEPDPLPGKAELVYQLGAAGFPEAFIGWVLPPRVRPSNSTKVDAQNCIAGARQDPSVDWKELVRRHTHGMASMLDEYEAAQQAPPALPAVPVASSSRKRTPSVPEQQILDLFKEKGTLTIAQFRDAFGLKYTAASNRLVYLVKKGVLVKLKKGLYALPSPDAE